MTFPYSQTLSEDEKAASGKGTEQRGERQRKVQRFAVRAEIGAEGIKTNNVEVYTR